MNISIIRNRSFAIKSISGLSAIGLLAYYIRDDLSARVRVYRDDLSVVRVYRTGKVTVSILYDYYTTLNKVDENSRNYERIKSVVHTRSAKKLLDLACLNRGTYIKIGQLLGALDYLLPPEYVNTLKVLHSNSPKSSYAEIEQVLKEELKIENIEEIFSDFSRDPIGTASLGQVHKATIKRTGEEVAVKVQHPRVLRQSKNDIDVMEKGIRFATWVFPDFKMMWLVEETKKHLPLELDFLNEAKNCEQIADLLKHLSWVKIPKIYKDMSTQRVMVMECCEGGQINDLNYFRSHNINANIVMKMLGRMYSEMIFLQGFVHCDPHPGNLLIRKRSKEICKKIDIENCNEKGVSIWRLHLPTWLGGVEKAGDLELVLLDHGLYQHLDEEFRYQYANLWQGLITSDIETIQKHSKELGVKEGAYPLFSTMVTARSWDVIENHGIDKVGLSTEEDTMLREGVGDFLPDISHILNDVSSPMIMLFKTNDLLRGLQTFHGTRADSSAFLDMSRYCIIALHRLQNKRHLNDGLFKSFKSDLNVRLKLAQLTLYEWYLWLCFYFQKGPSYVPPQKEFKEVMNK